MVAKPESSLSSQDALPALPKVITSLAWGGGTLVTLLAALVFFTIGYQSKAARLESAIQMVGHSLAGPETSRHEWRVPEKALASLAWLDGETCIRVVGENRQILAERSCNQDSPLLSRSIFLELGEKETGVLELNSSLYPLLLYSVLMLFPGLGLGWITFVTLREVPMRALRLALQEIATRKATEAQLAKSLSIFSATLESTADGIFVTDVSGHEVVTNSRFMRMWNLQKSGPIYASSDETLSTLANQLLDPAAFLATHKDLSRNIDVNHGEILALRDGRYFEWNSQPQFVEGRVVGRVSSFRDVSERKRAEALLAVEKEVLEMVVCGHPLKVALGVLARHVEVLSGEMFCAILFRENSEEGKLVCATGRSLPDKVVEGIVRHGHRVLTEIFSEVALKEDPRAHGLSDEFSGVIEHIEGNPVWASYCNLISGHGIQACFAVTIRSSDGRLLGLIVAHYRDPSEQPAHDRQLIWVASHLTSIAIERHQAEERLEVMAHYDALTNLPNRALFHDRLEQALSRAERSKGLVSLMFLDLDRFKAINDSLGHDSGDKLLREVALRLRRCIRETDTVARLGGDEFTVILEQLARPEDAAFVAAKIIETLAEPVVLNGQETFASTSIGITLYPLDGERAEQLIKNADFTMYRAKEEGGNGYRFFTRELGTLTTGRLEMESGLRHALERQEFLIHYQPKLDLASGAIIGAEALLRWRHPVKGLISPAEFIPILEETGLIEPVGAWVLKTVCEQLRLWHDSPDLPRLVVAVNLSARQLQNKELSNTISGILEATGLKPRLLELEVTESMLMHDPKRAIEILAQIRNKGILHIGVDDFGTGYSSLSYLKQFPIDTLKIDKSFVDGLPEDEDDIAISRAVIAMAHSLKLTVVAEGVEKPEQLEFLRENGCDIVQGYLVSQPVPPEAFVLLVRENARSVDGSNRKETKKKPRSRRALSKLSFRPLFQVRREARNAAVESADEY